VELLLLSLIIRVVCGVISAAIASSKGRSVVGWFFGGFFLQIIGIIIVAVLPNVNQQRAIQAHADRERHRLREQIRQERMKNESFRQYTMGRLDVHDRQLGVDTKSYHPGLPESQQVQALPPVHADDSLASKSLLDQNSDDLQQLNRQLADQAEQNSAAQQMNPYAQAASESENPVWYYERHGQSVGPVTESDIRRLLRHGQLDHTALLWAPCLPDWTAAAQVSRFNRSGNA
jgi:hypothetical protein